MMPFVPLSLVPFNKGKSLLYLIDGYRPSEAGNERILLVCKK